MTKGTRLLAFLLAGGLLCGAATVSSAETKRIVLMSGFDLDGEAADPDQVVTAANGVIVDSKTDYTITAQPDSCRLLDLTVVDTDLSAGTLTVIGTDCMGNALTASFAFTAGDDTGVKTLTASRGSDAYFKTVTGVTTGVMTGESDESFALGYSTAPANTWSVFGIPASPGPLGELRVNIEGFYTSTLRATTSGVLTTTVTSVSSNDCFTDVAVGDMLTFTLSGEPYKRVVTARASADSITVNKAISIPADGVGFLYQHQYTSSNPADFIGAVSVDGWKAADFTWTVDAVASTGGAVMTLECSQGAGPGWPLTSWVTVATATVATGGTKADTVEAIDLQIADFKFCRLGFSFTADDADVAPEAIDAEVALRK